MFKKKICQNCGEKISSRHNFCPECGKSIKIRNENEYGMLGKNDLNSSPEFPNMFGGLGNGIMGKMLNNAMKMLEKELQKDMKNVNQPNANFELFINGKRISPDKIKVTKKPQNQLATNTIAKVNAPFSSENRTKFLKLKKEIPKTSIKRLSNRIIYELEVPYVKSINDISIIQLENSIEVKALSKKLAYEKIISIGLPIANYKLEEGKLILEISEGQ